MKKTRKLVLCIIFIAAAAVTLYWFFRPIPLIKDIGKVKSVFVYLIDGNYERVLFEDYEEDELLEYLSTCKERRTLERTGSYSLPSVKLYIIIETDGPSKFIKLGKINFSDHGNKSLKRNILNPEEVIATLLDILNWTNYL